MPVQERMQGYVRNVAREGTVTGSSTGIKSPAKTGGNPATLCGSSYFADSLVNVLAF